MNKILQICIDDIIIDPAAQSEMITDSCSRATSAMKVTGVCQVGDNILLAMEPDEDGEPLKYILAPFNSENIDEIVAEISTRYFSGFSLIGGFEVKAEKWALFAQKQIKTEKNF